MEAAGVGRLRSPPRAHGRGDEQPDVVRGDTRAAIPGPNPNADRGPARPERDAAGSVLGGGAARRARPPIGPRRSRPDATGDDDERTRPDRVRSWAPEDPAGSDPGQRAMVGAGPGSGQPGASRRTHRPRVPRGDREPDGRARGATHPGPRPTDAAPHRRRRLRTPTAVVFGGRAASAMAGDPTTGRGTGEPRPIRAGDDRSRPKPVVVRDRVREQQATAERRRVTTQRIEGRAHLDLRGDGRDEHGPVGRFRHSLPAAQATNYRRRFIAATRSRDGRTVPRCGNTLSLSPRLVKRQGTKTAESIDKAGRESSSFFDLTFLFDFFRRSANAVVRRSARRRDAGRPLLHSAGRGGCGRWHDGRGAPADEGRA